MLVRFVVLGAVVVDTDVVVVRVEVELVEGTVVEDVLVEVIICVLEVDEAVAIVELEAIEEDVVLQEAC